jgi:hypothetical protein
MGGICCKVEEINAFKCTIKNAQNDTILKEDLGVDSGNYQNRF